MVCFLEDLKCWGASDKTSPWYNCNGWLGVKHQVTYLLTYLLGHDLQAQNKEHHAINRLEERGAQRGSARQLSLKWRERAIVNQAKIGTVSKATLGKFSERRGGAHVGFSERIDTILRWAELNCITSESVACDRQAATFVGVLYR